MKLGAVILAAGASSRMGRSKVLLDWGGTTILDHLIAQWRRARAAQIAVVTAPGNSAVAQELQQLLRPGEHCIVNPTPSDGMFSSIQCASAWNGWNRELTHFSIALGDQPNLQGATLAALLKCAQEHPGVPYQPARCGRAKHPVILPRHCFEELRTTSASTLKEYLAVNPAVFCELDDPALELDLDTPDDYERARQQFGIVPPQRERK